MITYHKRLIYMLIFYTCSILGGELGVTYVPHVICLFIEPLLHNPGPELNIEHLPVPKNISHRVLKYALAPYISLNATYFGLSTQSNNIGQIIFPRLNVANSLLVVVSKNITPVRMAKNTIQKFIVSPGKPAQAFLFEQKKDSQSGDTYWEPKIQKLSEKEGIPPSACILFTNPRSLYIPLKKTKTIAGPHLILPPFYITKTFNSNTGALAFLKIDKYFRPVHEEYRQAQDRLGMIVW